MQVPIQQVRGGPEDLRVSQQLSEVLMVPRSHCEYRGPGRTLLLMRQWGKGEISISELITGIRTRWQTSIPKKKKVLQSNALACTPARRPLPPLCNHEALHPQEMFSTGTHRVMLKSGYFWRQSLSCTL